MEPRRGGTAWVGWHPMSLKGWVSLSPERERERRTFKGDVGKWRVCRRGREDEGV